MWKVTNVSAQLLAHTQPWMDKFDTCSVGSTSLCRLGWFNIICVCTVIRIPFAYRQTVRTTAWWWKWCHAGGAWIKVQSFTQPTRVWKKLFSTKQYPGFSTQWQQTGSSSYQVPECSVQSYILHFFATYILIEKVGSVQLSMQSCSWFLSVCLSH